MIKFLLVFSLFFVLSCSNKSNSNWQGGIDSNDNGVRDDIDTWITTKANGNSRLVKALENLARVNPADCEYSIKAKCVDQITEDGILLQIELLDLQLNTKELREKFEDNVRNCPRIDDRNINYKCNL